MFTRQHYNFLAERINTALKVVWNSGKADGIQVYTLLTYTEMLASHLQADNPLFDPGRFYIAVCAGTPYSMTRLDSYRRSYLGGIKVLEDNIDPALQKLAELFPAT